MGRHKKEITKNIYIRFRVEPLVRKEYFNMCKNKNLNPSEELRKFILNEIKK